MQDIRSFRGSPVDTCLTKHPSDHKVKVHFPTQRDNGLKGDRSAICCLLLTYLWCPSILVTIPEGFMSLYQLECGKGQTVVVPDVLYQAASDF